MTKTEKKLKKEVLIKVIKLSIELNIPFDNLLGHKMKKFNINALNATVELLEELLTYNKK